MGRVRTFFDVSFPYFDDAVRSMQRFRGQVGKHWEQLSRIERIELARDNFEALITNRAGKMTTEAHFEFALSHIAAYAYLTADGNDFESVCEHEDTRYALAQLTGGPGPAFNAQLNLIWHGAQWKRSGSKIIEPAATLCERLKTLRVQGLRLCDIPLPFPSTLIMPPPGAGPAVTYPNGPSQPLRWLWVTESAPIKSDPYAQGDTPCWHFFAVAEWPIEDRGRCYMDERLFYWRWADVGNISGGWDSAVEIVGDELGATRKRKFEGAPYKDFCGLNQWILNLLIYLADPEVRREQRYFDPDAQRLHERLSKHGKGRKRDRIKDELRRKSQQRVIVVGRDVQARPPGAGTGRPLEIRQLVRGHRKRVRVGVGRVDRKEVTIAPYWRGPEDGEQSTSRYLLR